MQLGLGLGLGVGDGAARREAAWWHEEALLAADFEAGRWMRGRRAVSASALLTTTRSSSIVLPDSAGVFQPLGNNTLPRTDRGLYVNEQYGLENYSSVDFSASSAWSGAHIFASVAVPSVFSGQSAYLHTGNGTGSQDRTQNRILSSAGIIRISAIIEQVSADKFAIGISVRSPASFIARGIFTWSTGLIAGGSLADSEVQNLGTGPNGGALRLITFTVDTGAVTDTVMRVYPTGVDPNTNQTIIHYVGYQYPAFPLQPPAIAPNNAKFTTMASDIRAVQGVRPSNSQPEPFSGWEVAGLDDGFSVLLDFENKFVAPQQRIVSSFNTTGTQYYRFGTNSGGNNFSATCWDGTQVHSLPFGAAAGGRDRVALTITSAGAVGARAGSAALVSNPTLPLLSGLRNCFLGSDRAADAWWNDWIYGLQICSPLSDAALLEWVNA